MQGCLNIFDIDDTLFYTFAKIQVLKNGQVIKELTNQEFNHYSLEEGEYYNFDQFRSASFFQETSKPIHKMIEKAKHIIATQHEKSESILLTARADFDDREVFLQTFRDHNFPIDDVHVERAGNLGPFNKKFSAALSKMCVIRKYIATGKFNHIRVWDDSVKNLKGILKLMHLHPEIKIEAYIVYHDGSIERYE